MVAVCVPNTHSHYYYAYILARCIVISTFLVIDDEKNSRVHPNPMAGYPALHPNIV